MFAADTVEKAGVYQTDDAWEIRINLRDGSVIYQTCKDESDANKAMNTLLHQLKPTDFIQIGDRVFRKDHIKLVWKSDDQIRITLTTGENYGFCNKTKDSFDHIVRLLFL